MRGKIVLGILSILTVLYLLDRERKRGFENGLKVGRIRTLIDEGYDLDQAADELEADTSSPD
jgi:hypothetical protein